MSYKIISLNTWSGQAFPQLVKFISEHASDTDVFCFQEVFHTTSDIIVDHGARTNLFHELCQLLPNHTGYPAFGEGGYDINAGKVDFHLEWGLATFVHKNINLLDQQNHLVFQFEEDLAENYGKQHRHAHVLKIGKPGHNPITVINFHGLWKRSFGKNDSPERLQQSKKLLEIISKQQETPIVLTGDFNLDPHTESLSLLKQNLRDLISEYGITSTRSSIYTKPGRFADYAFVSPQLQIESFEVPQEITASDHLPLIIKVS